jgi:hypothetical protein
MPFGCAGSFFPATVYQQVYAASNFSGITRIGGVSFASTNGLSVSGSTFSLSISTTAKAINGLDTSFFVNNLGADDHTVFKGLLAPNYDGQTLVFAFTSPYVYDPSAGNLLLNFTAAPGATAYSGAVFKANCSLTRHHCHGNPRGIFSSAQNFAAQQVSSGLQTTFLLAPTSVPEPQNWALLLGGFALVGTAARRVRRPHQRHAA